MIRGLKLNLHIEIEIMNTYNILATIIEHSIEIKDFKSVHNLLQTCKMYHDTYPIERFVQHLYVIRGFISYDGSPNAFTHPTKYRAHKVAPTKDNINYDINNKNEFIDANCIIMTHSDQYFDNNVYHGRVLLALPTEFECMLYSPKLRIQNNQINGIIAELLYNGTNNWRKCKIMNLEVWFRFGKFHRIDGPAINCEKIQKWYRNGILHREDGPAIICWRNDGNSKIAITEEYYYEGKLHRTNGPALMHIRDWPHSHRYITEKSINTHTFEWRINGMLHRTDGPALIDHKRRSWLQNGKKHRENGPAVVCTSGKMKWYYNGKRSKNLTPKNNPINWSLVENDYIM